MSREKETMEQTATLEKEKENLARELASYINKEKDKVCYDEMFLARVGWVGGNFSGVVSQVIMPASHKFSIKSSLFKSKLKWLRPGTNQVTRMSFKMAQPIRKN